MKLPTNRLSSSSNRIWTKMSIALALAVGLVGVIVFFVFAASTPIITTVAGGRSGSWVQVRIDNLPANVDYVVYEGKQGTQGVGGSRIAGFNSGPGGTQYYRFELAADLMGEPISELRIVGSDGSSAWQTIGLVVTNVPSGTRAAGSIPVTGATAAPLATTAAGAAATATPLATTAAGAVTDTPAATLAAATTTPLATSAAAATDTPAATLAASTATPLAASTVAAVTDTPAATLAAAAATPLATSAAGAATSTPAVDLTTTPVATAAVGTAAPLATATAAAVTSTPLATTAAPTATPAAVATATPAVTPTVAPTVAAPAVTPTVAPTTTAGGAVSTPVAAAGGTANVVVPVTGAVPLTNLTFSNQIMLTRNDFGGVASFLISNLPLNTDYTVRIGPAGKNGENGYVVAHFYTGSQATNVATFEIPTLLRNETQLDLRLDGQDQTLVKTFANTNFPVATNKTVLTK